MNRKEIFTQSLKKAGHKVTPSRLLLLGVFAEVPRPISIEYILSKTKGIDAATIYRNVSHLQKTGIIRKVELQKKLDFYELATSHHHHIICRTCGTYEDIDSCGIENIMKKTLQNSKKFVTIQDHFLDFYGACNKCVK